MQRNITSLENENSTFFNEGISAIKKGRVAVVLLAGGQGTRLSHPGPKGTFCLNGEGSLFSIFFNKIKILSKIIKKDLHVAMMVSSLNLEETKKYFKENGLFEPIFLQQHDLPFLNLDKSIANPKISLPCGNGDVFTLLQSGILNNEWKDIDCIHILPIDNPLGVPFDPSLIGAHLNAKVDVSAVAIKRKDPQEAVGVFIPTDLGWIVKEYFEIDPENRVTRESSGELLYPFANISQFVFSREFIHRIDVKKMPVHYQEKRAFKGGSLGLKQELFIFDALLQTKKSQLIVKKREEAFSPLKNGSGIDSPTTVTKDLEQQKKALALSKGKTYSEELHYL